MASSMCWRVLRLVGAVAVIGTTALVAAPGLAIAAPRCAPVSASAVAPGVPWPQLRYDTNALSQITDGAGVMVAVLDSGVDARHPQLAGALTRGEDLLGGGDGREDCVGHGTAVAGIIAARPEPRSGPRGLAPGVTILPIRVSERLEPGAGAGDLSGLAQGIRAAVARRARVINLSLVTTRDDPAVRAAVRAALDADIVVVAAVGNDHDRTAGADPVPYPAAYDGVVGVGAIGPDGTRLPASAVGSTVDIVAPGDQIVTTAPGGGHASYQGTSFAVPYVAATAALIRARWPSLPAEQVVRRLLATADPAPGSPLEYGHGVLNPLRALTEVVAAPAAARPGAEPPISVAAPAQSAPALPAPTLIAAAALLLLAAAGASVAAALPAARRRGWRPGS